MPLMQVSKLIYKNFVWRIFFYISALLLNISIARVLGAELSGNFNFFLNDLGFFLLIGSFSLESGIIYFISKKSIPENSLASFALLWSLLMSGIISILFFILYKDSTNTFTGYFLLFTCIAYITGILFSTYFTAFFYSYDDYRTSNLVAGSANFILFFFILWMENRTGIFNAKSFFNFFFLLSFLQGFVISATWFLRKSHRFQIRSLNLRVLYPVFRYSLIVLLGNLAYFLLYRIDYWFVEYYCSAKSLGNYIQVSKLGQLFVLPAVIIAATLFPQSSKDNISFQSPLFKKIVLVMGVCYVMGLLLVLFAGNSLILFFWGNEYDEMYWPLVIMMPGIIFLAVSYLFSPIFAGKGKINYNVYIALITLAVVIFFNFLWIPAWGIRGAALATSAGFLVMMFLYIIIANKKFALSLKKK